MCNDPHGSTPSPHPTTQGSGISCLYGFVGEKESHNNLTTEICNVNQSLCLTAYGEGDHEGLIYFSCHDPSEQGGQFYQSDVCIDNTTYCWPKNHPDSVPHCMESTVCTCNVTNCNTYNASSTFSSASPASTQPGTQVQSNALSLVQISRDTLLSLVGNFVPFGVLLWHDEWLP